ncbi:MAG TPA: NAD(P)/FAD-dependent oxidoreductase [Candidatus Acidoferrales bacterium]|nr:NAD(P)/FAD-dependent oxidoreductase [Candidatus Acidoferrales bacterium]
MQKLVGNPPQRIAIIVGAGPAGLTAAFELITRSEIHPIVIEKSSAMGGISRTHQYKGNRIDLGGHRFFSKSDRVMNWWLDRMPLQAHAAGQHSLGYQGNRRPLATSGEGPNPEVEDRVMLLRRRKSRIYFLRQFFEYPIRLTADTLRKLGPVRAFKIGISYTWSILHPIRHAANLEQFFINRFGRELYLAFFKSYTEKVWGIPCDQISAEWGEQRIKGLSIAKSIVHFLKQAVRKRTDISQKATETSLIEQFLYPKYGPGQMWEEVACQIRQRGGEIITGFEAVRMQTSGDRVRQITVRNVNSGEELTFEGEYFFSTMPVKELIACLDPPAPANVREVSDGLLYRDFVTVGLLLKQLKVVDRAAGGRRLLRDNWIYIQEPDVHAGRLQIFNNWSPYLVKDPETVWLGVEYFCNENDRIWNLPDTAMIDLAAAELDRIGVIDKAEVLDATVLRMPKTYPAYFGSYARFGEIRTFVDRFTNLMLIGRNGMHKYNNQDHSMLTAMIAVDNIINGITDKSNLWEVNTEMEYHESSKAPH